MHFSDFLKLLSHHELKISNLLLQYSVKNIRKILILEVGYLIRERKIVTFGEKVFDWNFGA